MVKVDLVEVRKSLEVGTVKLRNELATASITALRDLTRENKMKAGVARKRLHAYENALKMSDDELTTMLLAGELFK